MDSLEVHNHGVKASYARIQEMLACSTSNMDPERVAAFISDEKEYLKDCDADVKDARRRISAAKGPRKARKVAEATVEGSDWYDSDVGQSD